VIQLTDEMKTAVNNALADKAPCVVATVSSDGKPSIGLRGSVMAYGDDSLAYWERTFRRGSENIESNPHIVILYRNPATRQSWKFFGQAEVHRDDDVREDVMSKTVQAELDRDAERKGVAVVVRLDRVETMGGEVLMSAD
jgi:general stress protein 26